MLDFRLNYPTATALSGLNLTPEQLTALTAKTPGMGVTQTSPFTTNPMAPKTGMFSGIGGLEGIGAITQGISSLGQLYAAIRGIGISQQQLNLSKEAWRTNLKNQTQSYNTALEDRIKSRFHTEGRPTSEALAYLQQHSL